MASLRYSLSDHPRIGFSLLPLGYEKSRGLRYENVNFDSNFDWFDCQLWIDAFDKKIEHPKKGSMYHTEFPGFISWLRELPRKGAASFQTVEPFFRIDVEIRRREDLFNVNLLLSAYGISRNYLYIDSGVAVKFPAAEGQFMSFADQLENELRNLQAKYSKQLELWNLYKEAEEGKWESKRKSNRVEKS